MRLDWGRLINDARVPYDDRPPRASRSVAFRTAFESDYDRVVYSPPFRRLARKTQVHPMAPNDHVHNRLTHSIEVASVGRSFARRLAQFLKQRNELPSERSEDDLVWILMAACAVHDIGNPPFGHAGEYAIREWSATHRDIIFPPGIEINEGIQHDVLLFEGNAQGFRIAARADNPHVGYMRLTFASLGAMVKYPWDSLDRRALEQHKYNCFSSERDIFQTVFSHMGLESNGRFFRHPLSFLSEAADDICYRVLDLEDAAELGVIAPRRVRDTYKNFLPDQVLRDNMSLAEMRGQVISHLIKECWDVFERDYDAIMSGERECDLKSDMRDYLLDGFECVKGLYQEIFSESQKVSVELGAFKAIGRILKALCNAISELSRTPKDNDLMFITRRCLALAWSHDDIRINREHGYCWWLHQVLDYVSGLTDNYARQLSREIEGT
ncbi:MAG: dNTP triphosphohydrolase [Planctomycetales bacterium]|nr:dNTP triphosphohydrolase [Planctomycetales bacterium]